MRKFNQITKRLFQIFLYLLETLGFALVLTLITNKFLSPTNWFDILERVTIYYTLYQIVIYNILQQLNDIKKDEYLALLSMYKYVEIYNSDKKEDIRKDIYCLIESQLNNDMLNDVNIKNEYNEIKKVLDNKGKFDETKIKVKILKYEHCYEEVVLNWKYSILLRIFK